MDFLTSEELPALKELQRQGLVVSMRFHVDRENAQLHAHETWVDAAAYQDICFGDGPFAKNVMPKARSFIDIPERAKEISAHIWGPGEQRSPFSRLTSNIEVLKHVHRCVDLNL